MRMAGSAPIIHDGSTGGGHTCPDLENLMKESPMPVLAGPQVSASLFKTLGALKEAVESLWNPDAGQPLEHLVSLIQESRALVRASSVLFSQEEAAAVNAAEAGDADSSDTEADEQQLADVEDTHAPDGPRHASASRHRHSWEHASERASVTPPAKKTRACEQTRTPRETNQQYRHSVCQLLRCISPGAKISWLSRSVRGPHPGATRLLEGILVWMYAVAWVAFVTLPGRAWQDCFDQAKGYQGEGLAASLHLEFPSGVCPMPAQKLGSCSLFKRKPRKNFSAQAKCATCGSGIPPRKECFKCLSCHAWTSKAACAREAARSCLCGHTGGAAHDSQSSAHDAPLGSQSSAEERSPRPRRRAPRQTRSWCRAR